MHWTFIVFGFNIWHWTELGLNDGHIAAATNVVVVVAAAVGILGRTFVSNEVSVTTDCVIQILIRRDFFHGIWKKKKKQKIAKHI